jgi:hypothetical protein
MTEKTPAVAAKRTVPRLAGRSLRIPSCGARRRWGVMRNTATEYSVEADLHDRGLSLEGL